MSCRNGYRPWCWLHISKTWCTISEKGTSFPILNFIKFSWRTAKYYYVIQYNPASKCSQLTGEPPLVFIKMVVTSSQTCVMLHYFVLREVYPWRKYSSRANDEPGAVYKDYRDHGPGCVVPVACKRLPSLCYDRRSLLVTISFISETVCVVLGLLMFPPVIRAGYDVNDAVMWRGWLDHGTENSILSTR